MYCNQTWPEVSVGEELYLILLLHPSHSLTPPQDSDMQICYAYASVNQLLDFTPSLYPVPTILPLVTPPIKLLDDRMDCNHIYRTVLLVTRIHCAL